MKRDFTCETYLLLLNSFLKAGYNIATVRDAKAAFKAGGRVLVLRHDVDSKPENSMRLAQMEHALGVHGTYYFRIVSKSFNKNIILKIADLGHEIGYHYEDIALEAAGLVTPAAADELIERAFNRFCNNLAVFRAIVPIDTICMHGSPLSRYDNKLLWKKYSYKSLDISVEPYFDFDFNEVAYFSDTGRRWNSRKTSARDRVRSAFNYEFRTTYNLISGITGLPPKLMITVHPQRWADNLASWGNELISQNLKNVVKYGLSIIRDKRNAKSGQ